MAPFDTTFYWSAIVNIALSCTVFELFDVEYYRDLEIWVRGHSRSFKLVTFESLGAVSYSPSIVTMALSCIISDIKQDIGRKSWFFSYHLAFDATVRGSLSEYCHPIWYDKSRMVWLPGGEKNFDDMFSCFDRIPACDRQTDIRTDGQTSCHGIVRAIHTRHAAKKQFIVSLKQLGFKWHEQ